MVLLIEDLKNANDGAVKEHCLVSSIDVSWLLLRVRV